MPEEYQFSNPFYWDGYCAYVHTLQSSCYYPLPDLDDKDYAKKMQSWIYRSREWNQGWQQALYDDLDSVLEGC